MATQVLALIPARGGSKSIPRKNLQFLHGLPLIAHTIKTAIDAASINRVVVSTDDAEIADRSREYGAEVLMRPAHLAGDETPMAVVVRYTLDQLKETERYAPDVLVLLQPTSPLRDADDVERAMQLFHQNDCAALVSVTPVKHHPSWMYTLTGNRLQPFLETELPSRRQELTPLYCLNGAIYVIRSAEFYRGNSLVPPGACAFIMSAEHSLDIDEPGDLVVAEAILRARGKER
ncbi:MAG: cytidylyltransferase domain-containing protein [Bacteroidota bacterium]